ncbi:MAG TPA: hypothetical protein VHE55_15400 [Fimbriimonadaceae bacterium]|nr:hypothetical protein [Fimbriimonadaceae bacterium]
MEESLIVERETMTISGNRNLYSYAFHVATPQDRLNQMIESGELGVVGAFLDLHPDLDLPAALVLAKERDHEEAVREIEART